MLFISKHPTMLCSVYPVFTHFLGAAALKVINSASYLSPQSHDDNIKLKSKENTEQWCTLNY